MSGITLKLEDLVSLSGFKLSSLKSVEELDLSASKIKYLESGVFSKLKNLKSLNLSNNLLRSIPDDVACDLSKVKCLNVSENALNTLEFLKHFSSLEDLYYIQNGLDPSQKFFAAYFCPRLKKIDGKDVDSYKHLTTEFKEKLKHLCEKVVAEGLSQTSSDDDAREELRRRIREEKPSISGLPASVKEFMIKDACSAFPLNLSPSKKMKSPVKRTSSKSPGPRSDGSRVKSPGPRSDESPMKSPSKKARTSKARTTRANVAHPTFKPLHFIRCHSGDKKALKEGHTLDDPTDELTNIWSCAFEPDPHDDAKSTGIVATCGGCMVCLIDCKNGQVLKRFAQQPEQFYCLAWTTLKIGNSFSNILAVSGHNGHLKLLNPSQLICFAEHGSGRPNKSVSNFYYSALLFHPVEKGWLFCSSSDTTVTLFDIGVPQGADYSTQIKQLAIFKSNPPARVLNMIINEPKGWLVGGTSKGIAVWNVGKDGERSAKTMSAIKRKEPIRTITLPNSNDTESQVVDGLTGIDGDLFACKATCHGAIYIFNINNLNRPIHVLKWHKTETEFIGIKHVNGILGCGDDDGSIWLYRVNNLIEEDNLSDDQLQPIEPFKILQWPNCKIDTKDPNDAKMLDLLDKPHPLVINNLAMDPKNEFLVALSDCNIVCIWKTSDS